MGLLSEIWNAVKTKNSSVDASDYISLFNAQTTLGMKGAAFESCVTYLARLVAKGNFVFKEEYSVIDSSYDYALNVRPNPNQTASEFKVAMVKKLLNGELLVVKVDDNFYIADNFTVLPSLNGHSYTGVTVAISDSLVDQKVFTQTFVQGVNCFHLDNDNIGLNKYVDQLWEDYGKLFGILITNQLRTGQLRIKLSIPVNDNLEENQQKKTQRQFKNTLSKSLLNDPVVLIPNGGKSNSYYEELSATNKSMTLQNQITDLGGLKKLFIGEIARLLGIPPALVLGETANNSENLDLAIETAVIPIGNKLSEGFASLLIKKSGYQRGKTLEMRGFKTINILDRADAIDKVGSSGVVKINEVREAANLPPLPDGEKIIMTKNYTKEGENSENS